jgi:hypothetical protein
MGKYMNDVQAFMQRHKHYIIYFYMSIIELLEYLVNQLNLFNKIFN